MIANVWSKVRDVATRPPVVVPPQTTLRVAAEVMARESIGALLVTQGRNDLGILSERDLVNALGSGADPDEAAVTTAMSHDIVTVRPHDTLYDAAVDMLDLGIRHVPVLDEHGGVVGVVSVRDLLRPLLTASLEHERP